MGFPKELCGGMSYLDVHMKPVFSISQRMCKAGPSLTPEASETQSVQFSFQVGHEIEILCQPPKTLR